MLTCLIMLGASNRGNATTLKRNGSDLSATVLGSVFRCGHITIWTDVDGVYSADPRKVSCCCHCWMWCHCWYTDFLMSKYITKVYRMH